MKARYVLMEFVFKITGNTYLFDSSLVFVCENPNPF